MKNIFLLCIIGWVSACMKIQKKSDLELQPEPAAQIETARPEPVVFTLDEALTLTEDVMIVADEVHLKSNARIYTNQFNLSIEATSIYIERGVIIQSFADHLLVTKINVPGLSGGTVQIKGNDIHGNLRVFMNGQTGGAGLGGWTALPDGPNSFILEFARGPCQPDSGKDSGAAGSFFLTVNQSQDFSISTSMKIPQGGSIGSVLLDYFYFTKNLQEYKLKGGTSSCEAIPSTGQPGSPGQICLKLSDKELARCEKYD